MNTKDQQAYLEKQIADLIDRFKKDRERHKRLAVLLKALTVSLAGVITILLGWKMASQSTSLLFANIALVLGAVITVLSAYEAFFDPRMLWVRETVVFARLNDLERDLAYAKSGAPDGSLDSSTLEQFKVRLDKMLEESLQGWLRMRGQDSQVSGQHG